jgi:integrase
MELITGTDHSQLQQLALELLPVNGRAKKAKLNQSSITVSVLVATYLNDRSKHLDERTLLVAKYVFDLLIWVMGDVSIADISRSDCREFRDTMLRLPPRALSYSSSRSALEVINMGLKPMNPKTVNKNIQFVSAMFNWAVSEELIADNPAKSLTVSVKRKASLERKAYDADTLSLVLSHLSPSGTNPENYWLPLLGYFTGMRIEELCQLRMEDVIQVDGVDCIQVSSEAGPLKTINAERIVPIHTHLIKLGFLDYVRGLDASKSIRLWPNLKAKAYGKFSSAYSKRFGRFKRKVGIKDRQLTFHSFRHTFANELKQVDVSEHLIAQLIGHSNSSITMSRYGKEYEVDKLSKAVEKLNLHGVSI